MTDRTKDRTTIDQEEPAEDEMKALGGETDQGAFAGRPDEVQAHRWSDEAKQGPGDTR